MTNNPTEQQATPNAEEELREKVKVLVLEHESVPRTYWATVGYAEWLKSATDGILQLITSEIEKAKVEARLEELQMLIGSGVSGDKYRTKATHGFQTIQERIEELSKLQEEQK